MFSMFVAATGKKHETTKHDKKNVWYKQQQQQSIPKQQNKTNKLET